MRVVQSCAGKRGMLISDSLGQSSGEKRFSALRSSSGCKQAFVLEIGVQRSYV